MGVHANLAAYYGKEIPFLQTSLTLQNPREPYAEVVDEHGQDQSDDLSGISTCCLTHSLSKVRQKVIRRGRNTERSLGERQSKLVVTRTYQLSRHFPALIFSHMRLVLPDLADFV